MSSKLKFMTTPANSNVTAVAAPTPPPGAKRQPSGTSLNHLLNFTLPPREPVMQHRPRRVRRTNTSSAIWNKERFVNAQYRFVVRPAGDYAVHFADPDIFFQWTDILEVIIPPPSTLTPSPTNLSCPICLSPPVAPRMTKCGHVYCYPCILHYLETSDNHRWARCPICFDSIYEKALKPVLFFPTSGPSPDTTTDSGGGDEVTLGPGSIRMRLMVKPAHTTLVLPRSSSWPSPLVPPQTPPYHFLPDVFTFSRFMLSTPQHLHSSTRKDLAALEGEVASLVEVNDELSASFARRAIDRVKEWMDQVDEMDLEENGVKEREKIERELETWRAREKRRERERVRERDKRERDLGPLPDSPLDFLDSSLSQPAPSVPHPVSSAATPRRPNLPPPPPTYYYYQACNGSAIFLHPLDIRILRSCYGTYEKFPDEVVFGVEASEEGRVTPALRKTHKYLSHLPEGQDITFIEADLSTLCTPEQLAPFEEMRRQRRERRREREDREERARRKAEREAQVDAVTGWGNAAGRAGGGGDGRWENWDGFDESDEAEPAAAGSPPSVPAASTSAPTAPSTSPTAGAWGNRTFASALHAPSRPRPNSSAAAAADPESADWDREVDLAWHELESRGAQGGGGKRKGRKKLVLLSGGGGRRA